MPTTLADLIAFHEIGQVKYRYLRALDSHDWDLMKTCFTPDARAWYSGGKYATEGRDQIIQLLSDMIPETFVGSHVVMHPEIEFVGLDMARGIWRLQDIVHFLDDKTSYENFDIKGGEEMVGAGYYYDEYVRASEGTWLIKSTGYERIFEYLEPREGRPGFKLLPNPTLGIHEPWFK